MRGSVAFAVLLFCAFAVTASEEIDRDKAIEIARNHVEQFYKEDPYLDKKGASSVIDRGESLASQH